MTQSIHDGQKLLVAVRGGDVGKVSLILAEIGEQARDEVVGSVYLEDHNFAGELPAVTGFYVWQGRIVLEDGVGMGEYGGRGDADIEWQGEWRLAELEDLEEFFASAPPVTRPCPRNGDHIQERRGSLWICLPCCVEWGQKSGELTAQGWHARNAERVRLIRKGLTEELSTEDAVRLGELNAEADRLVANHGRASRDIETLLGYLRKGREYLPRLDPDSIQCVDCWAVLSRTDLTTDDKVCRECLHKFTERELGHGGACCTACYPYPHHFIGQEDGLLTCAHCPARARESEIEFKEMGLMKWVDLEGQPHTFDPALPGLSCPECSVFLYPDGRDAQGKEHPRVHRDGNQHVQHVAAFVEDSADDVAPDRKEQR